MRDSRIGSYGALALFLALAMRIGALATLLDRTGLPAATGLVLAASLSRVAALAPMVLLPPPAATGSRPPPGAPATGASRWPVSSGWRWRSPPSPSGSSRAGSPR